MESEKADQEIKDTTDSENYGNGNVDFLSSVSDVGVIVCKNLDNRLNAKTSGTNYTNVFKTDDFKLVDIINVHKKLVDKYSLNSVNKELTVNNQINVENEQMRTDELVINHIKISKRNIDEIVNTKNNFNNFLKPFSLADLEINHKNIHSSIANFFESNTTTNNDPEENFNEEGEFGGEEEEENRDEDGDEDREEDEDEGEEADGDEEEEADGDEEEEEEEDGDEEEEEVEEEEDDSYELGEKQTSGENEDMDEEEEKNKCVCSRPFNGFYLVSGTDQDDCEIIEGEVTDDEDSPEKVYSIPLLVKEEPNDVLNKKTIPIETTSSASQGSTKLNVEKTGDENTVLESSNNVGIKMTESNIEHTQDLLNKDKPIESPMNSLNINPNEDKMSRKASVVQNEISKPMAEEISNLVNKEGTIEHSVDSLNIDDQKNKDSGSKSSRDIENKSTKATVDERINLTNKEDAKTEFTRNTFNLDDSVTPVKSNVLTEHTNDSVKLGETSTEFTKISLILNDWVKKNDNLLDKEHENNFLNQEKQTGQSVNIDNCISKLTNYKSNSEETTREDVGCSVSNDGSSNGHSLSKVYTNKRKMITEPTSLLLDANEIDTEQRKDVLKKRKLSACSTDIENKTQTIIEHTRDNKNETNGKLVQTKIVPNEADLLTQNCFIVLQEQEAIFDQSKCILNKTKGIIVDSVQNNLSTNDAEATSSQSVTIKAVNKIVDDDGECLVSSSGIIETENTVYESDEENMKIDDDSSAWEDYNEEEDVEKEVSSEDEEELEEEENDEFEGWDLENQAKNDEIRKQIFEKCSKIPNLTPENLLDYLTEDELRAIGAVITEDNKPIGFERGLEAEEIKGATNQNGKLLFLIKWKESNETDLVDSKEANVRCPQVVIKFYQEHLQFHTHTNIMENITIEKINDNESDDAEEKDLDSSGDQPESDNNPTVASST